MNKRVFCVIFFLSMGVFSILGQRSSASPYSFFGIGDIVFKGDNINRSMGGVDIYTDSIHINIDNPSSYSDLKATTYSMGLNHSMNNLASSEKREKNSTSSLDYISVGVPTKHFGFGFGLVPYSSAGYRLTSSLQENTSVFEGRGGLNQAYFSIGFYVLKGLSLGASFYYNFGNITNESTSYSLDIERYLLEENNSEIAGSSYRFSLNYKKQIAQSMNIKGMLVFNPKVNLTSNNERFLRALPNNSAAVGFMEEQRIDLASIGLANTEISLPNNVILGIGIERKKKWFIGLQYAIYNEVNFDNILINVPGVAYNNNSEFNLGGFFIPRYDSFSKYWNRVTYRLGMNISDTGLVISDQNISEMGLSLGLGLPFSLSNYSNFNLGFNIRQRGTLENNLIRETYYVIHAGLSLNDIWFIKRKYN